MTSPGTNRARSWYKPCLHQPTAPGTRAPPWIAFGSKGVFGTLFRSFEGSCGQGLMRVVHSHFRSRVRQGSGFRVQSSGFGVYGKAVWCGLLKGTCRPDTRAPAFRPTGGEWSGVFGGRLPSAPSAPSAFGVEG